MNAHESAGQRRDRARPALVVVGLVAAFLYSSFIIDWVLRGFSGMGEIVSELAAPGEPNATLLRICDVVCAVLVVSMLPWVRRRLPPGGWRELCVWAMVVFAVGATVAAVVATPCGPGAICDSPSQQLQAGVHDASSIVSDTAFYVSVAAAWLATRQTGPRWFRRIAWWDFWLGGVVASLVFEYFNVTQDPEWAAGVVQRIHIVAISIWIATLGVYAGRAESPPE